MQREAPIVTRQKDDLSSKIRLVRRQSPAATLRLMHGILWARWSLRNATSMGRYVKLIGRLRVRNKGRLIVGDRVLLHSYFAPSQLAVLQGAEISVGKGTFINYGAD